LAATGPAAAERIISDGGPEETAKGLGSLLHETRRRKKCLSPQVAIPYVDETYDAAIGAGAYAGKFAGAGNGGYLFLLAPPEKKQKIKEALGGLVEVAIKFESEGSKIIYPA
jgi:D-glycero-alpha-D-manno-heptose-7-phosphate kinase